MPASNTTNNTNREFIKNDSNQTDQIDQSQSTTVMSSNNNNNNNLTTSNGLVRRLSVTARPGDIFYKVKDVTETATTDTLTHESNNNNNNNSDVNDYAEIDDLNDDEEKEIIIKPMNGEENDDKASSDNDLPSPTLSNNSSTTTTTMTTAPTIIANESNNRNSFQTANGTNNKKITSWKVNRHQTTSLGINQPIENQPVNKVASKDDIATNVASTALNQMKLNNLADQLLVNNNSNNNHVVEPGSPQFTKELLSIR